MKGKSSSSDKKLFKTLEMKYRGMDSESSSESASETVFGPLSRSSSRKLFYYFISTLNGVFPDYDFRQENQLISVILVHITLKGSILCSP